jgi:hypothetical protein
MSMRSGRRVATLVVALVVLALAPACSHGVSAPPTRESTSAGPAGTTPAGSSPVSPTTRPTTPTAHPSTTKAGSSAPAARPAPVTTRKKGVSAWSFTGFTSALADSGASWFYNWAASRGHLTPPAGVEFVPMIWGADAVKKATLDEAKRQGRVLLGFNEPDLAEQSNLSVERALDLWPQLEATGLRLGSPAPAWGAADPGRWFDRFMTGAAERGYRVDFIALHWYGSDFSAAATGHLRGYLQAVYDRYHKPIWLTEYSLINFSGSPKYPSASQQAAFARASVAMLEDLPFVERYAWFALPATPGSGTGLYRDGWTPTAAGAAYRLAK